MTVQAGKTVGGGEFLIGSPDPETVFTPDDFTDEHRMIAQTARRFVEEEVIPRIEEIEGHDLELTVQLLRKACELGLLAIDVPEEFGGLGLDKPSSTIVSEILAQVASFSASCGGHAGIGTLPIVYFGSREQKSRYLPRLARGEMLAAYALSEAGSGSDALAAKCRAVQDEQGEWILNGEKMWITNAGFADLFIVFARIDGRDFSAFIVERSFPGVSVGAEEKKMGIRGSSTCTLLLEDARVPEENLLGERGQGHRIALNILNIGRYKLGAACVGAAKKAISEATAYALERHQFGRPIAEFGAIQEKLARMAVLTWIGESMSYRTVGMIDSRLGEVDIADPRQALRAIEEFAAECSIMKVWCSEMLDFVVDEAVQIFGGNGYSQEYAVERYYRDSRINRIFEGTNEINRLLIPTMLLRRARKGELPLAEATGRVFSSLTELPGDSDTESLLGEERQAVEGARKSALLAAALARRHFGERLGEEQEVLMAVSDMLIEVYAMQSGLLRALKASGGDPGRADLAAQIACCQIQEALQRVLWQGRQVLAEVSEGDDQRTYLAALRGLCRHSLPPLIRMRRRIARRLLDAGTYSL